MFNKNTQTNMDLAYAQLNTEFSSINTLSSFLSLNDLLPLANKPSTIVQYNNKLAIKADITTNFNIYSSFIKVSDLGFILNDNIYFSCRFGERGGSIFLATYNSSKVLITQNTKSTFLEFGSVSNVITSDTVYVRVIILINTSAGINYAYIVNPILSKQEANQFTIGSFPNYENQIPNIATNTNNIAFLQTSIFSFSNLILTGGMSNLADWTRGTFDANGINVSGSSVILASVSSFSFTKNEPLSVIFHAWNNNSTNAVIRIGFYNGVYGYPDYAFTLTPGENILSFSMPQNVSFVAGTYKLYLNAALTVNISIKSIVAAVNSDASTALLLDLYKEFGFKFIYSGSNFSKNASSKASKSDFNSLKTNVDGYINQRIITLHAYATTATQANDPSAGIYAGTIANVNAIQRAIDSVPVDGFDLYQIRCYGDFTATTFAEMSAIDSWTGTYYAMVSITKKNIHLIGSGERATVIFANLPDTGAPINYMYYQTMTVESTNCTIENIVIKGANIRYPVHTEANESGVLIDNAKITFKNVWFCHLGNTGQAYTDWKSYLSYGIGFGRGMVLTLDSCRFTSIDDSGLGGHDGYNTEYVELTTIGCTFDCKNSNTISKALNFRLFGNTESNFRFNLIGNNFNNGQIYLGDLGQSGNGAYGNVSGYGNSKFIFNQQTNHGYFPEISDVKLHLVNKTGGVLGQYLAIDDSYQLATGEIFAVTFQSSANGEKYVALKNTFILMSLLTIKAGETIIAGNYVSSNAGQLVYSSIKTTAKCIDILGVLYLSID